MHISAMFLVGFFALQGPLPTPLDVEAAGKAKKLFFQGMEMIGSESEYSDAQARFYRDALALAPDFEQARHNLILVLLVQEKFQEAEEHASELISRGGNSVQGYLLRAETRLRMDKFKESQEDLDIFLAKYPEDPRGLELLGKIYAGQGSYAEAIAAYKRAGKYSEGSLESRINIGLFLLNSGKRQEAVKVFSDVVTRYPKAWVSYYWLGVSFRETGNLDEALSALKKAEKLDPGNERARKELVEIYLELEDLKNAEIWINRKKDKTASDYMNLALLAGSAGTPDEVLNYIAAASELAPDDVDILSDLGDAQVQTNKIGEAAATFRRILKINPEDCGARLKLASVLLDEGKAEEAGRILERAVILNPDSAEVHLRLALVMDNMGDFARARREYRKTLELGSLNPDAHFRLGLLLAEEGEEQAAIHHLTRAVSRDPGKYIPLLISETKKQHSTLGKTLDTPQLSDLINKYKDHGVL